MRGWVALVIGLAACGGPEVAPAAEVVIDLDAIDTDFFAHPWPSDLRLDDRGRPDTSAFPNPRRSPLVASMIPLAADRPGWPVVPVAYFRFTAPLAPRVATDVIDAAIGAPILIVDVDPDSPDRGSLVPAIAQTLPDDRYTVGHVLAVAPRPGWILAPDRTHAVVVLRSAGDAGRPLSASPTITEIVAGGAPVAGGGERARALYAPLLETLDTLGISRSDVVAATVFTTGDVVADLLALTERVRADHDATIGALAIDPDDGVHERYCELVGTATLPQFQRGEPPFDTEGLFEIGEGGAPIPQRDETIPIVITIPRREMPASGWPLMTYFHGSGGDAAQVVDRGPRPRGGENATGEGPAFVVAERGIAALGSALPISPDRVPGAGATDYLNFENLAMMRDLFRQGVIEQRLLLDAMLELRIDPAILAACTGAALPAGASAHVFDPGALVAMGQSMGGMYTNLVGAVEPRYRAFVPTGAGGYWTYFILETELVPGDIFAPVLGTPAETFTHLHPAMSLVQTGFEPIEPFVSMPRLSRRPLPGFTSRPVYQPVGMGDSYFPITIYDAAAIAYGHEQVGDEVWPSMQPALALAGRAGIASYPVVQNLVSESGEPYTGVVAQFAGDGFSDPHDIFTQLPGIRYQYGCFFESVLATDVATLPAPEPAATCPR